MKPRFRAINPETGSVSRTFEITFHKSLYVQSDEAFIWEPRAKGLHCAMSTKEPILSQSTGLTDSRGTDVFDGDVILWNSHLWVVHYRDAAYFLRRFGRLDDRGHPLSPLHLRVAYVVGNRYMSPDTLRARAEEVMNG